MFSYIKELIFGVQRQEVTEEESDWETLKTPEDERRDNIRKELIEIKNSSSMNNLKYIITCISSMYKDISEDVRTNVETSLLSLSSKENIFLHFVEKCQKGWRDSIIEQIINSGDNILGKEQEFIMKWERGKYQKNICGEIISHGNLILSHSKCSINIAILKDITWKYYVLLSAQLSQILERRLTKDEGQTIISIFVSTLDVLINDWNKYVLISGDIENRLNILPKKWETIEVERMKTIRLKIEIESKPSISNDVDYIKSSFSENKERIKSHFLK